ncbi:TP53-binding protein 1 [Anthophora quadrimaculata]
MSGAEKREKCTMESQAAQSESLEESKVLDNSGLSLNESQDFHLVDMEEEESSSKSQEDLEDTNQEEAISSVSCGNTEVTLNEINLTVSKAASDAQNYELMKEEDAQKKGSPKKTEEDNIEIDENSTVDNKNKHSDEDEEIIQCTPPEIQSPSKKQAGESAVTSLKRKAGVFDEPPKKILKTSSKEDSFLPEKRELEEDESCHSFKSDGSHREYSKNCADTSVIIPETQDVREDDDIEAILEKQAKYEEKTKDERHPELGMKDYEIDKNENFNDTSKLNEALSTKERSEEVSDAKNVTQSNDSRKSPIQIKEKDSTSPLKAVTGEKLVFDSSNKSTDIKVTNSEEVEDRENGIESKRHTSSEQNNSDGQKIPESKEINESHLNMYPGSICKSRQSVELIYDRTAVHDVKTKSKELVEIDEDGEKIVLDSSQEDSVKAENKNILDNSKSETIYKSCYDSKSSSDFSYKSIENTKESSLDSAKSGSKLVNGSSESERCDTDSTVNLQSDAFSDTPVILDKVGSNISTSVHNINRQIKPISLSKDSDHADLLSVSDNEPDVFMVDDKSKSNLIHSSSITKALQVEKEIGIYVRMKCLLRVDEGTKEFLSKEITGVQCEPIAPEPTSIRQKNNDTSASLADISGNDNKDTSPGSVNSNPQLYQLNPSRLSFVSTVSSLSSVSSAASLAAKFAIKDNMHFSLPRAPAKYTKRHAQDMHLSNDRQSVDEAYERLTKEWQNSNLLAATILNFANTELTGIDAYNISNERIDDQLQKIRSSTPEVPQDLVQVQTPRSTKKSKSVKRSRSKSTKLDDQSNGLNKVSAKALSPVESNNTPSRKRNKSEQVDNVSVSVDATTKLISQMITDELIGKDVFAKWSDNNYYPGIVIDKIKAKYKVNFYDGKNKVLIADFVIPIPKILKKGLSIYATTKNYDYGSCGIIVDSQTVNNDVYYTVETDEGEKLRVQIKDMSLTADQAQMLKEEISSENKSLLSTPKNLGQITLDNMVDGKRRSKRIATPTFSTPKLKSIQSPSKSEVEPSVSGIAFMVKKDKKLSSESDGVSSDSNISAKDEVFSIGVQPEIIGTPYEQIVKGPQNRIKSKSRSKKKTDDEETIAVFGPIPRKDSNLFKGMSFILTCAPVETIDRFQFECKDYGSDPGTEPEEEWVRKPFVRDRLHTQIIAGGGKVYTDFNEIPQDEYKHTKLITNVPNTTAKTLLCLSVGIPAYNHNWIIRCCQEGKLVKPAENELPVGWSLNKHSYIDMFQRPSTKPLTQVVIIIPLVESEKQFAPFWRQICENAGAVVLLADKPDTMESFVEGTVVLANDLCPSWAVEKATELQIPLLSTTWIVQSLIEGKLCPYDDHSRYKYNYKKN